MKSLILYSIIGASALAVGAGGGIVYKRVIQKPTQNITGFNPEVCKPNAEELFAKVNKVGPKIAVSTLEPVDIANYATEKYKTYENSVSFCKGLASTIVSQEIRNAQIKNGSTYFEESVSKSSMVGIGKRMIQEGIDGPVKMYNEKSAGDVTIDELKVHTNFKDKAEDFTSEKYKEAYGRTLNDMFIYCVHSITVKNGSVTPEGDGYKVVLDLDPIMGGYQYRYQMLNISGLDALPIFNFITITYTLDSNLDLVHIQAHEAYRAKMGVEVEIENTLEYDFFPNVKWEIPQINEDINYEALKEMVK